MSCSHREEEREHGGLGSMSYKGQDLAYGGTLSQEGARGFGAVALHNQVWIPWMVVRELWLLHLLSTHKKIYTNFKCSRSVLPQAKQDTWQP